MEAGRAREYYRAADNLLPLISPDSRAALWVLVTIYRRLLQRIENAHYEVFAATSERAHSGEAVDSGSRIVDGVSFAVAAKQPRSTRTVHSE